VIETLGSSKPFEVNPSSGTFKPVVNPVLIRGIPAIIFMEKFFGKLRAICYSIVQ